MELVNLFGLLIVTFPCKLLLPVHCSDLAGSSDNTEKINIATETLHLPNGGKEIVMNDWENNLCAQADIGTAIISDRKGKKSTISGMCCM